MLRWCFKAPRAHSPPATVAIQQASSDEDMMFDFKVHPCTRADTHDHVSCPGWHPSDVQRRRDPRSHRYAGIACPRVRQQGTCELGDACPYAHNDMEFWLHPSRYRTQLCRGGGECRAAVCYFAHTLEELRLPSDEPFVALPADKHSGEAGGAAGAAGEESLARLLQLLVGQPPPLPRSDTGCSGGGSSADASGSWAAAAAAPSPSALAAQRLAAAQLAARAAAAQQERLLLDPHLAGQVSQLQHQLHPPSRRMADSAAARLFAAPHGLASLVAAPSTSSLASAATFAEGSDPAPNSSGSASRYGSSR